MDTLIIRTQHRRTAVPRIAIQASDLFGLLQLSSRLLEATDDHEIASALGHYLAAELHTLEALLVFSGAPDVVFQFNSQGNASASTERHGLLATAQASLRGSAVHSGSTITVAHLASGSHEIALVVRWHRHGAQRLHADQDPLLARAAELTATALRRMRARELERKQSEVSHACELARRDELEEKMRLESMTDAMTGLTNRRGFFLSAEHAFKAARRRRSGSAVIFADVDNLKAVNDGLGHEAGDALISDAAGIFKHSFRGADIVARLGGDEFVAYTLDDEQPAALLRRIDANIMAFNSMLQRPYQVSFSTGVVACDPYADLSLADYLVIADQRMYERKQLRTH